jgi:LSD1 subclass zinc finger protein
MQQPQGAPGPEPQQPVNLQEQPIDDGSVVAVECPVCHALMTAPKGAPAIRCPQCNNIFDRVKAEKSSEEIEAMAKQAQIEPETHPEQKAPPLPDSSTSPLRQEDLAGMSQQPASSKSKSESKVDDALAPGPLSQTVMSKPSVAPVKSSENDLSSTGEQSTEESG